MAKAAVLLRWRRRKAACRQAAEQKRWRPTRGTGRPQSAQGIVTPSLRNGDSVGDGGGNGSSRRDPSGGIVFSIAVTVTPAPGAPGRRSRRCAAGGRAP